ncbi:MAG: M90 family metallopeptidase [Oceanospirillaceae bacterium]
MLKQFRDWLENRRVKKMGFTQMQWESAIADWPVMERYQGLERDALRNLTFRFIVRKTFASGGDFKFTTDMCLKIATMACVPILHLGLDWYDHWETIILYEGDFMPNRPYRSEDGVVHTNSPGLSGEAWLRGPIILSWKAVCATGAHVCHSRASNVVIHELSHKLDMLRDGANGAPPMHPGMRTDEWHDIFSAAWDRLHGDLDRHRLLPLDGYALTNPAEFFAVCSETFFEDPQKVEKHLPDVYRLLCQFYRQQPIAKLIALK